MRWTRRTSAAILSVMLALGAALAVAPGTGVARPQPTRSSSTSNLAPGLTLTRISDASGPYLVKVLTLDPTKPITLDIATASGAMGAYARTSQIGAAHGALASINGDFTVNPGRPLHPFAEDGTLRELGLQNGASFAIRQDESGAYIDTERVGVRGRNLTLKRNFPVAGFNTDNPTGNAVTAYTAYGGTAARPPTDACSVRLKTAGKLHWGKSKVGVSRAWKVVRRVCQAAAMPMKAGTTVLSSKTSGTGATILKAMKRGQLIRLTWSFGWADVMDSVGGMPLLVENGQSVAPTSCGSYFCSRNPRTAIATTADGKVLLVVVDGRSRSSVGMTLSGWAHYLVSLGAVYAVNLDGGGGSTMWAAGQGVINHPSDPSGERPVTNAVLVLPGPDTGEVTPLPFGKFPVSSTAYPSDVITDPLVSASAGRRAMAASLADPGSTGGLMDAFMTGAFGPSPAPNGARRMAHIFRGQMISTKSR